MIDAINISIEWRLIMLRRIFHIGYILIIVVCVLTSFFWLIHQANATGEKVIFKDLKNGYFMFLPPPGWSVQEQSDPRTKVSFLNPTDSRVMVRFIVREAPGENFNDMKRDVEATRQSLQDRVIASKISESDFMGVKSIEIFMELPGGLGFTTLRKFLIGGLHFNIQYSAPSRPLFDKHQKEFNDSLDTIILSKTYKPSTDKAKAQDIAHYLRLAELTAKIFKREEALSILKEAMNKYPEDKQIKDTLLKIDKKSGQTTEKK